MKRVHITVSREVLERIDATLGPRHRGRFLAEAAREKLDRLEKDAASGAVRLTRYRTPRTQRAINARSRRARRTDKR